MPSLHMLGHMVAMAVIATLVKQIMELNVEVNKLKYQLEELRSTPGCGKDDPADEKCDEQDSISDSSSPENPGTKCSNGESKSESGTKNKSKTRIKQTSSEVSEGGEHEEHHSVYTSVWCHEDTNQVCQFENLCYNSAVEEFVMFRHELTTLENVNFVDGALTIDLSTVKDHNALQLTVSSLPSDVFSKFKVKWVNDMTLVFHPFLPDNLMHMFHDDLIPLHHTLKLINMGQAQLSKYDRYNVQMFLFSDKNPLDPETEQFYSIFSKFRIKSKIDYKYSNGLICFSHIQIGLLKTSTWYDYGFSVPQGPLSNVRANSQHIRSFVDYIRNHTPAPSINLDSSEYMVFFSRRENRKILNEMELTFDLIKNVGLKVIKLDYDNYSLLDLIHYVSHSQGIIGMHGSLLILSIFLKPGSFVVELFPYAVNPANYTPYKTLTQLPGMQLVYKSWANQIKANSIGHADWSADVGGLIHLGEEQMEIIMSQTQVPKHLCCKDPSWLYHIYQDTAVLSGEVVSLVKDAICELPEDAMPQDSRVSQKHSPSKVRNVSCVLSTQISGNNNVQSVSINIHWDVPWTMNYINVNEISYEVLLQPVDSQEDTAMSYTTNQNDFIIDNYSHGECVIWVRAIIEGSMAGPYSNAYLCKIL